MIAPPAQWVPHRGEIYCASGLDKRRPVIVISADFLNRRSLDVTVVPIASVERLKFSFRVPISAGVAGLRRDSFAKCDGVVTINKSSILFPPLGTLPTHVLSQIENAIKEALELP